MSEHIELRWPVTPLSATLREGELAPPPIISAVEHLEAINAKLLAALEECLEQLAHEGLDRTPAAIHAREAIREAKEEV
jgi:hypothetical protein